MKKIYICILCLIMILLPGCRVNEYYSGYEKHKEEEKFRQNNFISKIDFSWNKLGDDVKFSKLNEKVDFTIDKNNIGISPTITVHSLNTFDKMNDLLKYYDIPGDFITNVKADSISTTINDDGTISKFKNMDYQYVCLDITFTNNSSESQTLSIGQLALCYVDLQNKKYCNLNNLGVDTFFDKMQSFGSSRGHYEFKAGETIRTILVYMMPKREIHEITNNDGVVSVSESSDINWDMVYLRPSSISGMSEYNYKYDETFIKIK